MILPTAPAHGHYPSVAEGRPSWATEHTVSPALSEFVNAHDERLEQRDAMAIKWMTLEHRRRAWKKARDHLEGQGLLLADCNNQGDVDLWSPMFRRIVVWLT